MNDEIIIDEEKLKHILMAMILAERNNNRREEYNDVQMVDQLLKILEEQL